MSTPVKSNPNRLSLRLIKVQAAKIGLIFLLVVIWACNSFATATKATTDTTVSAEIRLQLGDFQKQGLLHFPKTVSRFYRRHNFQPIWINPGPQQKQTWEAVLMINCVLQFGLCHADYHPKEIDYARLHLILEQPGKVNNNEKARYELLITDALVSFMNHLHYGKLNSYFTAAKIDAGGDTSFAAGKVLGRALTQPHFMTNIVAVQPASKAYTDLEEQMRRLTQFQEDCYGMPDSAIRKMAINLERLRWIATTEQVYLQLNVPASKLIFHLPDTNFEFRAIAGPPQSPTPQLISAITNFTTASKLKISRRPGEPSGLLNPKGVIYFWFKNPYGISICGRPEPDIFDGNEGDESNGEIKIENGERLASLLLKKDGRGAEIEDLKIAIDDYAIKNFILNKPIPLKITYITCEAQRDAVITYPDIYNLDNKLERALYNADQSMVSN